MTEIDDRVGFGPNIKETFEKFNDISNDVERLREITDFFDHCIKNEEDVSCVKIIVYDRYNDATKSLLIRVLEQDDYNIFKDILSYLYEYGIELVKKVNGKIGNS